MDSKTLEHAFDPFFTTRALGEGTGLGLSMVLGIVRNHQGAIDVDTAPGRGATFTVYWPILESLEPTFERSLSEPSPGHGERVLYVDDERALVSLAAEALGALGYRITGFSDPHRALAAFDQNPDAFDLVVTDLSMPGMSGIELAKSIHRRRPQLSIVLISGNLQSEDRAEARAAGVQAVLEKPGTVSQLPFVMRGLLDACTKQPATEVGGHDMRGA
jgi:CheY-like chemotaxis protein